MKQLLKHGKWGIIKAGAILSTLSALVSDILEPACKATLACLCAACAAAFLIWIAHKLGSVIPKLGEFNKWLAKKTDGAWYLPAFIAALLACGVFTAMYALNHNDPDGYLAEHSSAIRKLQESTGLINAKLAQISENTERTAGATADTASALGEAAESAGEISGYLEKIVNPEDARALLAMRGRRFDANGFANSVYQGDLEDVDLFLKAGMNAATPSSRGERPLYRAVLENMPNSRHFADLFISSGHLSPVERVEPVALPGYATEALRQFGQWLDNDSDFFAQYTPQFANELGKLSIADCIALGEFLPQEDSLKLIRDHNLDMSAGILIREKLANAYEGYLRDSEKKFGRLFAGLRNEYLYERDFRQCKKPSVEVGDIPQIDQFPEVESGYLNTTYLDPYASLGHIEHEEPDENGKCPEFDLAAHDKYYEDNKRAFEERISKYDLPAIRKRLAAYKKGTETLRLAATADPEAMKQSADSDKAGLGGYRKFEQRPDYSGKIGQAYIPPLQPGQIRIYGPLNSVGEYDDFAMASRKGSSWINSVFGRLGAKDEPASAGENANAWFYADIDKKTGRVVNCRFYADGGFIEKAASKDITDLVREDNRNPGEILKNHFTLTFRESGKDDQRLGAQTVIISGETGLLKARDGQKVLVRYVMGGKDVKRFANMLYGDDSGLPDDRMSEFLNEGPGDFGYGEATIERND